MSLTLQPFRWTKALLFSVVLVLTLQTAPLLSFPFSAIVSHANGSTTTTSTEKTKNDIKVEVKDDGGLKIDGITAAGSSSAWNSLIAKFRLQIAGVLGLITVASSLWFGIHLSRLMASAHNPSARQAAISGCLWTGLATMGLGAMTIIIGFFYNAFG